MRSSLLVLCVVLLTCFAGSRAARQNPQDKAGPPPKMTPEDVEKKNPVASTPEGLAEARKLYGYDCAMCHGKEGDGKGDLAADMKLELRDWRDPASLEKMTDGELFFIVNNGKGKMEGEGDRSPAKMKWNLVNLERSFAKKGAAEKPKSENTSP